MPLRCCCLSVALDRFLCRPPPAVLLFLLSSSAVCGRSALPVPPAPAPPATRGLPTAVHAAAGRPGAARVAHLRVAARVGFLVLIVRAPPASTALAAAAPPPSSPSGAAGPRPPPSLRGARVVAHESHGHLARGRLAARGGVRCVGVDPVPRSVAVLTAAAAARLAPAARVALSVGAPRRRVCLRAGVAAVPVRRFAAPRLASARSASSSSVTALP